MAVIDSQSAQLVQRQKVDDNLDHQLHWFLESSGIKVGSVLSIIYLILLSDRNALSMMAPGLPEIAYV